MADMEKLRMDWRFWKNKKVLVTGFEGFLGSHLTHALIVSGAHVIGLDKKVGRRQTILTQDDYRRMRVVKGRVENDKLLKDLLARHRIDVVFHLAAEALVGECHSHPCRTFSSNIKGTWNVLEACRHAKKVSAVVVASSDKAYGEHKKLPYREEAPLIGRHPYDVSKSCADLLTHAYFHSYGLPVAITRCGNIYGPGDFNFSRLIPDTIRCGLSGRTLQIRSNGMSIRDYIFVDDIVQGYLLLAQNICRMKLSGRAFNFSNEEPVRTRDMVKAIFRSLGCKPRYRILNTAKFEIERQYLDSRKARKQLRWRPAHSLQAGLRKTVAWYVRCMASDGESRRRKITGSRAT